jgi:IclR family transcriptional regulator, acetate operon repressor
MQDGSRTLDKALYLLRVVVADGGRTSVSSLAARLSIPRATANRLIAKLEQQGLLTKAGRGRYRLGYGLTSLVQEAGRGDPRRAVARPILERLARDTGLTAHFGILENDMVTYLVKTGADSDSLFSRENMQLEAYCSAIGKVLLAWLPQDQKELYLAGGPFVRLTSSTITDPEHLRRELQTVRENSYAKDRGEISDDLHCVAVPVMAASAPIIGAISLSAKVPRDPEPCPPRHAPMLHDAAALLFDQLKPFC